MAEQKGLHDFVVEENGHKMRVVIPKSDDKDYDDYLVEAETEKTRDELKHKPPPAPPKVGSREALVEQIKERQEYNRRREQGYTRRYW